jgi:hypothetical protein
MPQKKPAKKKPAKPVEEVAPAPVLTIDRSRVFSVMTANLLNMIFVTAVFATVLAVLFGMKKWV